MFIEDEMGTRNFFARERFTCECRAEVVDRESKEWRTVMSLFKKKFGRVYSVADHRDAGQCWGLAVHERPMGAHGRSAARSSHPCGPMVVSNAAFG
jgi:hypothetical protein